MDAFSDVLRVARLKGGVFLQADFFEPWCMAARLTPEHCAPSLDESSHLIPYHFVVEGKMSARVVDEEETFQIGAGEVIMFPHNDVHLLGSDLDMAPATGEDIIQVAGDGGLSTIHHGGEGASTRMVCGFLGCDMSMENPVISSLPSVLRLDANSISASEWIRSTFQYAAAEVAAGQPGSGTVLAKLSELLFVEAIRHYADTLPENRTGWLAGLRDPHVSRVLTLFHSDVSRSWTVEALGREVGLSRSALADRFTRIMSITPMQYLTNWRMQIAGQQLLENRVSMAHIANSIGYESEAAFSRAFKKATGQAPASWRRSHN